MTDRDVGPATAARSSGGRPMHEEERPPEPVRARRGTERVCRSWDAEAAQRMLMNNLDPEVAVDWKQLVVYGGSGRAARNWRAYRQADPVGTVGAGP